MRKLKMYEEISEISSMSCPPLPVLVLITHLTIHDHTSRHKINITSPNGAIKALIPMYK